MTALSVERYLAICLPLRAGVLVTRRRVRALIVALWAVALLSAGPFFFLVGVEQDPGRFAVQDFNGTTQLIPSPRTSPLPLGSSGAPLLFPPSGPEAAVAAALFSRECRPNPGQLGALRIMLWVTTAYFFLPSCASASSTGSSGGSCGGAVGVCEARPPPGGRRVTGRRSASCWWWFWRLVCWLPFHVGRIIYINTEGFCRSGEAEDSGGNTAGCTETSANPQTSATSAAKHRASSHSAGT